MGRTAMLAQGANLSCALGWLSNNNDISTSFLLQVDNFNPEFHPVVATVMSPSPAVPIKAEAESIMAPTSFPALSLPVLSLRVTLRS